MTNLLDHAKKHLTEFSDEAVRRYHFNLRSMAAIGIGTDDQTMLGEQARKRAVDIEAELLRRGIAFEPIAWPES